MKFDEFSQLVKERVKSVVKTQEFKQLVDELDEISHYRSMYPVAKKRVAEIIGKEWHCPPYEQFYRVTVERVGLSPPLMQRSSEIAITITAEGTYLFEELPLDLSSEAALKARLFEDVDTISVLTVTLLPGAEDDLLEPLFRALAPLGVGRVSVVSAD